MIRASSGEGGFTIVELLVALLIFGMLSAAGVALLSFSVRAQDAANARLGELSEVRRTGAILTADLAQATERLTRDEAGAPRPAFEGNDGGQTVLMGFTRRGWENLDNADRPSIQKVEYLLGEGRLERRAWRFVDGAAAMPPTVLIEGVRAVRLRYRDQRGEWRDRWDPNRPVDLPRAVELTIDTERYGNIRQLFLVGVTL
ncbi:type II secretion system minor pseudopilin GspJ [Allosphingosinicella indica]|uniref:Type II secretion system protein J n=1 Tax=Allosphingosinicella indica TaxID=941907 RepID=A0A1X7H137_9SPHN|nr:type II secretion system minor pseudopilin GspJ [Allosphingosinicella indica]SMF77974.1 type II secretion system protein J (GspJ) [Allosphingosinicella indica]